MYPLSKQHLGVFVQTGCSEDMLICLSGATRLIVECFYSLTCWFKTKEPSTINWQQVTLSCHDKADHKSPRLNMPPTLGHIILIPSESVFAYSPYRYVLGGEASYTNCMIFGLNWRGSNPRSRRTSSPLHDRCGPNSFDNESNSKVWWK